MKLSEHQLRNKDDLVIFKALLRASKESGRHRFTISGCKSNGEIIRRCYKSRDFHNGEQFLENIIYWPSDSGFKFERDSKLLYYALLINNLDVINKRNSGLLVNTFKMMFSNMLTTKFGDKLDENIFNKNQDIIANAFIKCSGIDEKEFYEILGCVQNGIKEGIPF